MRLDGGIISVRLDSHVVSRIFGPTLTVMFVNLVFVGVEQLGWEVCQVDWAFGRLPRREGELLANAAQEG